MKTAKLKRNFKWSMMLSFGIALLFLNACNNDDDPPKTTPEVATLGATNVTTTSATVSGTITDNGNVAVTATGIVYSSNVTMPTLADNKVALTDIDGDFSAELVGLSSGTTYYARAYATNSIGTGYGDVVDFTTGNEAPTISGLSITGTVEVNKEVTATYTYTDAENDAEGATVFQWYMADDASGTGETAISGATSKMFLIQDAQNGKYLSVSVTPKAATGTSDGTAVKSSYTGQVGAETVTFTYNNQEVTYGTITSTVTGKKWLDRNLGAGRVAQAIDDYVAYGDMFQWGRLADGHQLVTRTGPNDGEATGVTGITSTTSPYETSSIDIPTTDKFIIIGGFSGPGDWRNPQNNELWQGVSGINNPCPEGWRIPTQTEWVAEGFTSGTDAFAKLKLTYSGQRDRRNGNITTSTFGIYWSSTTQELSSGKLGSVFAIFDATTFSVDYPTQRAFAQECRCLKD